MTKSNIVLPGNNNLVQVFCINFAQYTQLSTNYYN